jgi:hypothetical protein
MSGIQCKTRNLTAAICLASLHLTSVCGFAQSPATPSKIFIQILDGEGALNDIRGRTAREPIVEIDDENHRPIAGAVVIFTSPGSGPSATFANGLSTFQTTTLNDGRAAATGFKPNSASGSYQIQVSANFGTLSSVAVINQTNVSASSSTPSHHAARPLPMKAIAIVATVAGGAIVAGYLATRGQHSDTVTAGAPTVGAP